MDVLDLFEGVAACRNSCAEILIDNHTNIPRGYFTLACPGDAIDLMLVAQNPGQPMPQENRVYQGLTPRDAASKHLKFVHGCFLSNDGKQFHARLNSWMSELFQIPVSEMWKRVVYTNAVKCTTIRNALPLSAVAQSCIGLHLRRELLVWNPKVTVALGNGASVLLKQCGIAHEVLPHPSHRRENSYHGPALDVLRRKLVAAKHAKAT
jgi:hypothetical protein